MKKRMIRTIITIWGAVCLTMTGCGVNQTQSAQQVNENSIGSSEERATEGMDWDTLIGNVSFPDQYSITYEIDQENGTVISVTKGKDSLGNIYYKDDEIELLFKKDGTTYRMFQIENGSYVEDTSTKYKESYIEEQTKKFQSCASQNNIMAGNAMKYLGDTAVAERGSKDYGVELTIINYKQNYIFTFDDETGICLKKTVESKVGKNYQSSEDSFICTEFVTENVVFDAP